MMDTNQLMETTDSLVFQPINNSKPLEDGNALGSSIRVICYAMLLVPENVFAMVALYRCRYMCKQIKILAMNMAVADIVVGLTCLYGGVISSLPFDCTSNMIMFIMMNTSATLSMFTVTLFAVDRCCSIYLAMKYILLTTPQFLIKVCCVLWLFCIALCSTITLTSSDCYKRDVQAADGVLLVIFVICCVVVLICYVGIFLNMFKHYTHERKLNLPWKCTANLQIKMLFKVTTIIFSFYICLVPLLIYVAYILQHPEMSGKLPVFKIVVIFLVSLNSFLNPFLYVWRFRECRAEVLKMIYFWNKKKRDDIEDNQKLYFASYLRQEMSVHV